MHNLRPEQLAAIEQTFAYYESGAQPRRFLWNAKPRFGKTLAAYRFAEKIAAERILILTNRPATADSWAHDFFTQVAPHSKHLFAAPRAGSFIADGQTFHIHSRAELAHNAELLRRPLVFFISLQDLKGHSADDLHHFKTKNRWIFDVEKPWDLVIIDEGHEGIKTSRAHALFRSLKADFTLVLSGTPFRALADRDFPDTAIYNWTYLDERKSGRDLPTFDFRTAALATFLDSHDPACYDLAEFFRVEKDQFAHRELVDPWLDHFAGELANASLPHSLWLLSGVAECRAMAAALAQHQAFKDYKVVLAAGKTDNYTTGRKILDQVRAAIGPDPAKTRTITLSCGQLTTGVTVPEWSTVVMLYNTADLDRASSTQYLQAAFRAQNPHPAKTVARIFDFLPDRALIILSDYAENLSDQSLPALLDHLTVSLYADDQTWRPLTADKVVNLPRALIASEIVDGGFIASSRLFRITSNLSPRDFLPDAVHNVLSQPEFKKLPRTIFTNLAALETILDDPSSLDALSAADQELARAAALEIKNRARRAARKKAQSDQRTLRSQLRDFARTVPLLLHLDGNAQTTFANLATCPHFSAVTGLSPRDFRRLAAYFDATNFDLAIREFLRRRALLSIPESSDSIFRFIPTQRADLIFTPPHLARQMVDLLERERPELFHSPTARFLDPASKSGLFLREIARRLFLNLRPSFATDRDCLAHILTQQLFASSVTPLQQLCALKTLLPDNLELTPAELMQFRDHMLIYNYDTISTILADWSRPVKFDVIISNPPYQSGRRQVYADFYKLAVDLDPELLCMIFPQGWQKVYNHNGLGQINNAAYKRDPHLVSIDNYPETGPGQLFPTLGTGGVNIVLRNRSHDNAGQIQKLISGQPAGTMILPLTHDELAKPSELTCLIDLLQYEPKMDALGSARKPYGFYADPLRHPEKYHLHFRSARQNDEVRLFGLRADETRGFEYVDRAALPKVSPNLDAHKLFVPKAWGNMSTRSGLGGSYANICVAAPGDACSETFIEFGPFASRAETIKMAKYFMTQFFRALLFLAKDTQNTAKDKYRYVPVPPNLDDPIWQRSVAEIGERLFTHYDVPEPTRNFIRTNIQPRSEANIEVL